MRMKMRSSISVTRKYASLCVHSSRKHATKISRQDVYLMFSEKDIVVYSFSYCWAQYYSLACFKVRSHAMEGRAEIIFPRFLEICNRASDTLYHTRQLYPYSPCRER